MTREDRNIWSSVTYDDAMAGRAWLSALGFEEGVCVPGETRGSVMHSEMLWPGGGRVMVHSRCPDERPFDVPRGAASGYVVTDDPDAVHARATELGAPLLRPMEETDYGSRGFSIVDAEGNRWSFGTYAGRD